MKVLAKAIVGGGCFWCIEAPLQRLKGVHKVESGYTGGNTANPTYNDVCSGMSNHAEVCQVHYDPNVIDYASKSDNIQHSFISFCISTTLPL